MRHPSILLAAATVLAADAFVLAEAAYNRSGRPFASIEITERELRLVRLHSESTAFVLQLAWEPAWGRHKFEDGPGWLDWAKLEELGYDCRLPLTDTSAPAHYGAMPPKQVFAVLEYSQAAGVAIADRSTRSRLIAIDAGPDYALLHKKYPDTRRFLILPAMVRLYYEAAWDPNTRARTPGGYLRGAVTEMLVGEISVPSSLRRLFEGLDQITYEYPRTPEALHRGPRYAVSLNYGRNYEPWIGSARLLAPAVR
jgi:hypothetical protein